LSYRMRIIIALLLSVLANGWIWSQSGQLFEKKTIQVAKLPEKDEHVLLRLAPTPEPQEKPKRFVDTTDRGETQTKETGNIAEVDTLASDNEDIELEGDAPKGELEDDMLVAPDTVNVVPPVPLVKESPEIPEVEIPEETPEEERLEPEQEILKEEPTPEPEPELMPEEPIVAEDLANEDIILKEIEKLLEEPVTPPEEKPREDPKDEPKRMEVAKAFEPPLPDLPLPQQPVLGESNTRFISPGEGVVSKGILNFEANADEMAPYMKELRKRVRREWLAGVQIHYPGTSRAKAVVKCSIRPNGTLNAVNVLDAGNSVTFSLICVEAIRKAGPFPKFPFEVPEIYRNDNLEITWTFSYL